MVITSKDNETIKKLKKLKEKKYRDQENCYIIEGVKLIKEAIQENAKIKLIIVYDKLRKRYKGKEYFPLYFRFISKMEATL